MYKKILLIFLISILFIFSFTVHAADQYIGSCYKTTEESKIVEPSSFAVSEDGKIFICNDMKNRIQVYLPDGSFQYSILLEDNSTHRIKIINNQIIAVSVRWGYTLIYDMNGYLLATNSTSEDELKKMEPYYYTTQTLGTFKLNKSLTKLEIYQDYNNQYTLYFQKKIYGYCFYIFAAIFIAVFVMIAVLSIRWKRNHLYH